MLKTARSLIVVAALITASPMVTAQDPSAAPAAAATGTVSPGSTGTTGPQDPGVAAPATEQAPPGMPPVPSASAPPASPESNFPPPEMQQSGGKPPVAEPPEPLGPPGEVPSPSIKSNANITVKVGNKRRLLRQVLALIEIEHDGNSMGTIKAKLHIDKAPNTVSNFIGLATGTKPFTEFNEKKGKKGSMVKRPFYDGLTFHRIVPGFLIQGGCPFGTGRGDPGFTIPDEISRFLSHDRPGVISMANRGPRTGSGGSQFFITLGRQKSLDGKYAIFGQVIDGMDVVEAISKVKFNPLDNQPVKPVIIKKISIQYDYAN